MGKEADDWMEMAGSDHEAARLLHEKKIYHVAAFLCQQSAEKALKSVVIGRERDFPKIHDLLALGKMAGAPEEMWADLASLSAVYIESRYGMASGKNPAKRFKAADSEKCLKTAEQVLEWAKKRI